MSDVGVAEIPVDEDERPLPPPPAPVKNALMDGPILRTLLSLAWPNVIALSAGTCVVIAETSYIGRLGVELLAAMALVFPCVVLTMTMSGGAMGGGVASAIARALGAGDRDRASTLAAHAMLIGIAFGLVFMLGMLIFGRAVAGVAGRPRQCAGAGRRLHANLLRRRRGALADEHHGGSFARHRQHEAAVADDAFFRRLPDRSGRHSRPRPRADPVLRHARRRRRFADRLPDQHFRDVLVSVLGPGARGSKDQGTADSMGDAVRHPEGRRGLLFLAAAVGADHQHLHLHAGGFRHRNPRRLRHRRAARIPADVGVVRGRDCVGADDRHGGRCEADRTGAADRLDRGHGLVRLGRRDREPDRDLSGSLGQHLHR